MSDCPSAIGRELEQAMAEALASRGLPATLDAAVRLNVEKEYLAALREGIENHKKAVAAVLYRKANSTANLGEGRS